MPSFTGMSFAFIDSTNVTYSSSASWAHSSQNGWRHTVERLPEAVHVLREAELGRRPAPAATSR